MHRFEIWAPKARKLAVRVDGVDHVMSGPDGRGWWRCDVENAGPGSDYGYRVDEDATCYPDPRSLRQPQGVHGLSQVYDHTTFAWTDGAWRAIPLASAIVYELHVGTFTPDGTLDAATEKLAYLRGLGVTHVELMPVAAFVGRHGWGYDGVALFAVHEPYGGPDALKRFVNAAHAAGLAVLLDVVYNHFGPVGNYTGKYGPYLTDAHKTPWGGAVNLEGSGSAEVRRFFCDNALLWLRDFHIDGLRLDAVHAFVDRSAIHFLEQVAIEVEQLGASVGREFVLIAESDLNDPRIVTPREAGGLNMDAQWSDDFHHALFAVLSRTKETGYYADFGSLQQLAKSIEQTFVYDGIYSAYRKRIHGRPIVNLSQHRFLGYIQNHDQVGNRVAGERISAVAGLDRAKVAAALVLLGPFVPMILQGEEWASESPFQYFADHDDPEMARLVSEGRKREFAAFGWKPESVPDPEDPKTFERSKINWDERSAEAHGEMLEWYRSLIRLRRATPCLNNGETGNVRVAFDEGKRWLTMQRGPMTVACNLGDGTQTLEAGEGDELVLASKRGVERQKGNMTLPPDSAVVLRSLK